MTRNLLVDLALAALAGYLGTKAMEPIAPWLYERESQADRDREEAVRPGAPYRIAAQKSTALIGLDLSDQALDKAALAFHYGLAVSWVPTYALLRRHTSLGPVAAGLASGAAMSALVDGRMVRQRLATRTLAVAALARARTAALDGLGITPTDGKTTLAEYAPRWLAAQQCRPSTLSMYSSHLRDHIVPMLGRRPMGTAAHRHQRLRRRPDAQAARHRDRRHDLPDPRDGP